MGEQSLLGAQRRTNQEGQIVQGSQTNVAGNVQGPVLSGQFAGPVTVITGADLFSCFAQAPALSRYIRAREFQTLVNERTRNFVGREFIFRATDDIVRDPEFPSGYIVISGEPGIGKRRCQCPADA
jgi:hypothetical protein